LPLQCGFGRIFHFARILLADSSVNAIAGLLAFGCAALRFPVAEELLTEAHEFADMTATTAMFFVGFLIFLLLGLAQPRPASPE
jgi:ZIP family zinc transporter